MYLIVIVASVIGLALILVLLYCAVNGCKKPSMNKPKDRQVLEAEIAHLEKQERGHSSSSFAISVDSEIASPEQTSK